MNYAISCQTAITQTTQGLAQCSSGWIATPATIPFDLSQISPEVATTLFGAGFALFLTPWLAAFGFSQLLKMIKR
jgi:hypothetical protein